MPPIAPFAASRQNPFPSSRRHPKSLPDRWILAQSERVGEESNSEITAQCLKPFPTFSVVIVCSCVCPCVCSSFLLLPFQIRARKKREIHRSQRKSTERGHA